VGTVKLEQIGRQVGIGLFRAGQSLSMLLARLCESLWSIWHGSISRGWFVVLLLGGVGMISIAEHAAESALLVLSGFSITSKLWHWQSEGFFALRFGGAQKLFEL
jgi:hypothetical protein